LSDVLVDESAPIWTWRTRDDSGTISTEPSDDPYDGPVEVLVDVISGSAAELFAGGLQAIGRAVIAGERTAGRLLGGEIAELPIGSLMIFPTSQPVLADGTIVESRGVIPDLPVAVRRSDLVAGIDPVLRAAIEHLQSPDD
jgi:carboxyl-terminal processing protease